MSAESTEQIGLAELVDLSIGSPEKGAVNFNLVKSVLQILIRRLLAEDENISVVFRGSSAALVRNLRNSFRAPVQCLDMVILNEKRHNTNETSVITRIQTDLENVRLDVRNLQDRVNNMMDHMKEVSGNLLNRFQVTPLLIDEKMKDLLWISHESGYKTEPSDSARLMFDSLMKPDDSFSQKNKSSTQQLILQQLDGILPQPNDHNVKPNEILSPRERLPQQNGILTQHNDHNAKPNDTLSTDESLPQRNVILPQHDHNTKHNGTLSRLIPGESFPQRNGILPQHNDHKAKHDETWSPGERLPQQNGMLPQNNDHNKKHDETWSPGERLPQKNGFLPQHNDRNTKHNETLLTMSQGESLPQVSGILPQHQYPELQTRELLRQYQEIVTQQDKRSSAQSTILDEKRSFLWNHRPDECNTRQSSKSIEIISAETSGSINKEEVKILYENSLAKSEQMQGSSCQTQIRVSIDDEMRPKFPSNKKNTTHRKGKIKNSAERKESGANARIQHFKENTPVDQRGKRTSTVGIQCNDDILDKQRTEEALRRIKYSTEQTIDALREDGAQNELIDAVHINSSTLDQFPAPDVELHKTDNLEVPFIVKLDKKEKLELAARMKKINLSSLYGRNRHCALDDPHYLNSDMYDDKGLLKPMYDTGCFQSAYAEALKRFSSSTTRTESLAEQVDFTHRDDKDNNQDESLSSRSTKVHEQPSNEHSKHKMTTMKRQGTISQQSDERNIHSTNFDRIDFDRSKQTVVVRSDHQPMPTDVVKYLFGSATSSTSSNRRPAFETPSNVQTYQTEYTLEELTVLKKLQLSSRDKNVQQSLHDKLDYLNVPICQTKSVRFSKEKKIGLKTDTQSTNFARSILKRPQKSRGRQSASDMGDVEQRLTRDGIIDVPDTNETRNRRQLSKANYNPHTEKLGANKFLIKDSPFHSHDKLDTPGKEWKSYTEPSKCIEAHKPEENNCQAERENFDDSSKKYQGTRDKRVVDNLEKFEAERTHTEMKSESPKPINVSTSSWYKTTEHKGNEVKASTAARDSGNLHLKHLEELVSQNVRTELLEHETVDQTRDVPRIHHSDRLENAARAHGFKQRQTLTPENYSKFQAPGPAFYESKSRTEILNSKYSHGKQTIQDDRTVHIQDGYSLESEPTKLETRGKIQKGKSGETFRQVSPLRKNPECTEEVFRKTFIGPRTRQDNTGTQTRPPRPDALTRPLGRHGSRTKQEDVSGDVAQTPKRPPGRRGPRPKQEDVTGDERKLEVDVTLAPRDPSYAWRMRSQDMRINVLHMNSGYNDTVSSINPLSMVPIQSSSSTTSNKSVDNLSSLFPPRKKYFDLDRIVSELLDHVTEAEYDPFKQCTGDALNIILHILDNMTETSPHQESHESGESERVTSLMRRVDALESEMHKMSNQIREMKLAERKDSAPSLNKEAVLAIKQLRTETKAAQATLEAHSNAMDQIKLCVESLYDFVKDMDRQKMDRREMDILASDIIERSRMDEKVDANEFQNEVKRLADALVEATAKQDIHTRFQLLQCDVTNKIFELLPNKLEKSEYDDLTDDKLSLAMRDMEARLKDFVLNKDRIASGAKGRVVIKDLLCISCNNEVVMGNTKCGSYTSGGEPFHAHQHKSLKMNRGRTKSPRNQNESVRNRYCGATLKMTMAQKLALAKRYPLGQFGEVTPPHLSAIAKKYLCEDQRCRLGEEMEFPDVVKRSVSK